MTAISYFAKDLPRLLKHKRNMKWEQCGIEEIRGKTLGIVGYGDIGRSAGCYTRQTFAG
jgi:phosphoglycerate dehydrogenase-like enzyme